MISDRAVAAFALSYQKVDRTNSLIYAVIARCAKKTQDKILLRQIARRERMHACGWADYTGRAVRPCLIRLKWYLFLNSFMGYTFVVKLLKSGGAKRIKALPQELSGIPEMEVIFEQKREPERIFLEMLNEERVKYVGDIALGMNDAIIELTGVMAGMSFALMSNRLVMLTGIVTGISAGMSMAASNYLAEKTSGSPNALKSGCYTGVAYLVVTTLLISPFVIASDAHVLEALGLMFAIAAVIIFLFSYYISVAKSQPFRKRFTEILSISFGVSLIAVGIGLAVRHLLGIEL